MGQPVSVEVKRTHTGGVHRLNVKQQLAITKSCWLAARGIGGPKTAVEQGLGIQQNVMAHTGVVQLLVGNQPIRLKADVEELRKQLALQQEHYRTQANYENPEHRLRFVDLFEQAIKRLD